MSYCVTGEILLGLKLDPDTSPKTLTVSVLHCCRMWDKLLTLDAPKGKTTACNVIFQIYVN